MDPLPLESTQANMSHYSFFPTPRTSSPQESTVVTATISDIQHPSEKESCKRYIGITFALICAFLGAFKGYMVSSIVSVGPVQIFGLRCIGSLLFALPVVVYQRRAVFYDRWTNVFLLLRSLLGNVAVAGYYVGFAFLPLADASLLYYTTPLFTTFIGCAFLKEDCGFKKMVTMVLCITGVFLVTCGTFTSDLRDEGYAKGAAGALVGAFAQAVVLLILRKVSWLPSFTVSFWWAATGTVTCLGGVGVFGSLNIWRCGIESAMVVTTAVVGFASEICLILSLAYEEAGLVSVTLTSEILWAFVFQECVQANNARITSYLGAALILFGLVVCYVDVGDWRKYCVCKRRSTSAEEGSTRLTQEEKFVVNVTRASTPVKSSAPYGACDGLSLSR